jgi:hypothetical protein
MFLKVDVIFDRIRWEARSVQHDELEVGGKFVLGRPRKVTVADAPVNENQTLHLAQHNARRVGPASSREFRPSFLPPVEVPRRRFEREPKSLLHPADVAIHVAPGHLLEEREGIGLLLPVELPHHLIPSAVSERAREEPPAPLSLAPRAEAETRGSCEPLTRPPNGREWAADGRLCPNPTAADAAGSAQPCRFEATLTLCSASRNSATPQPRQGRNGAELEAPSQAGERRCVFVDKARSTESRRATAPSRFRGSRGTFWGSVAGLGRGWGRGPDQRSERRPAETGLLCRARNVTAALVTSLSPCPRSRPCRCRSGSGAASRPQAS